MKNPCYRKCSLCKSDLPSTFGIDGLYACNCGVRYQALKLDGGLAWSHFDSTEVRWKNLEQRLSRLEKKIAEIILELNGMLTDSGRRFKDEFISPLERKDSDG